jgi:hypothetical protein
MAHEKADIQTEAIVEILESQRRLADLLEETIRRQDDLIHELHQVVNRWQEADSTPGSTQPHSEHQNVARFTNAAPSRPPNVPAKCRQCSRYLEGCKHLIEDNDEGINQGWATEYTEHPLWDSYPPSLFQSRYRSR